MIDWIIALLIVLFFVGIPVWDELVNTPRVIAEDQRRQDRSFWRARYLDPEASIIEKSVAASLLEMWDPKYLEEIERTKRLYSGPREVSCIRGWPSSDQKMSPKTRESLGYLSESLGVPYAELVECYRRELGK